MLVSVLKSVLGGAGRVRRARARALLEAGLEKKNAQDYQGACRNFEEVLALDPDHVDAHHWLGILLARDPSTYSASVQHLERALALDPHIPAGWVDLGCVYYFQRDHVKAAASFRAALAVTPDLVSAHANLGLVLKESNRRDEALVHLRRAHELAPEADGALRNLVTTLIESDLCEEALAVASAAVERNPASYEARLFLAFARLKLNEPETALACYDDALKIRSDDAELYYHRGLAFQDLGRLPEAFADYERAHALEPRFSTFHRTLAYLLVGDFQRGWESYEERRLSTDNVALPTSGGPQWDGSNLAGRTILVRSEQGLGDEIMFASILPEIIGAAEHCIIECEPRLQGIFSRSFPAATVYAATPDRTLPPEIAARKRDVEVAAPSLPQFLRRSASDFPRHAGYLKADPLRVRRWRERLAHLGPGLKVGISWTGGVRKTRRVLRSIPLERLLPVLATPGARFVSLQYTAEAGAEIASWHERQPVRIEHWAEALADYDETAALVQALDLVVSVCTSVVHLSGSLGQRVWVMAPYSPEWRYGFSGESMPWYPSVKIFRQPAFGEWDTVISSVAAELGRLARATGAGAKD
jgi:tetratricopeptide (TPR) repeat protein